MCVSACEYIQYMYVCVSVFVDVYVFYQEVLVHCRYLDKVRAGQK